MGLNSHIRVQPVEVSYGKRQGAFKLQKEAQWSTIEPCLLWPSEVGLCVSTTEVSVLASESEKNLPHS